jgi:bifunctional DNA-binding transcriptional regulator/antitoxin component of YhaV-PrlF toxin-antitoxin module
MTVTADSKRRIVLPSAKPGDLFEVEFSGEGKLVLTRLEPIEQRQAKAEIQKRGKYSVGVLDRPINEAALKEALADFP